MFSCDDSPGQCWWFCLFVLLTQSSPPVWVLDKPRAAPLLPTPPLLCWEEWQAPCRPPPYRRLETKPGSGPKRAREENASSCGSSPGPTTKRVRSRVVTGAFSTQSINHNSQASSWSARFRSQQHPPQLGRSTTPWDEKPRLTSDEARRMNEILDSCIPHGQCKAPDLVPYHKLVLQDRRCRTAPFKHDKAAFQQHEHYVACIKALLSELNKTCDQTFRGVKPDPPRNLFQSMGMALLLQ